MPQNSKGSLQHESGTTGCDGSSISRSVLLAYMVKILIDISIFDSEITDFKSASTINFDLSLVWRLPDRARFVNLTNQ